LTQRCIPGALNDVHSDGGEGRVLDLGCIANKCNAGFVMALVAAPDNEIDAFEQVLDALRSAGHRITTARRLIVACLLDGTVHHTAEELASSLQRSAPDVHLSTIYRNLDELERLGVIEHFHLGHGPATYQLATHKHGHFTCMCCNAIFEAPDELFGKLGEAATALFGFVIGSHHFAIPGVCASCRTHRRSNEADES
jgi:Fur family ferric uptake transcriptional regulator